MSIEMVLALCPQSGESNRPLTPIHLKKYRDTPPMAYFCKCMPSLWQKVVYTTPICITIRLPFVSRYFCGSIRVRGRWDTPNSRLVRMGSVQEAMAVVGAFNYVSGGASAASKGKGKQSMHFQEPIAPPYWMGMGAQTWRPNIGQQPAISSKCNTPGTG